MDFRVVSAAVAAGLCMAVGYVTYRSGDHVLGMVVWFVGVVNLVLLVRGLRGECGRDMLE